MLGIVFTVAMTTALGLLIPYLTGRAIDRYISVRNLHGLAHLAWFMLAACILNAAGTWIQNAGMIRIAQRAVSDIRHDLFIKIQTLSLQFFDRHPHGELMSRLTNDTENISSTLGDGVTQFISSILSVISAGTIMLVLNWRLAIVCMTIVPMVFVISRVVAARTRREFRDRQKKLGTLNSIVEETILGQRAVKVYCREKETLSKLCAANADLKRTAILALIYAGVMGPLMNMFRNMSFAITAGAGSWMVVRGWITVGMVAAFISYADYFNRPLNQLANLYSLLQSALAGAERVFNILDEVPKLQDSPDAVELTDVRGDVEFRNVSFGYGPDVAVLQNVSFSVKAGQTIAVVGPTGAGKTTIINLLTRFYDIDDGSISIDGIDIRDIRKDSLRRSLGIVLQDTFLFAGKVRENIRYGRLDSSDAEVEAAARLANADSFIRHLPHGFDTILSDAGNSLSQGQRQLLAIARALLADPAILILDEATSSVDTRTEAHIQQALQRLMNGRTSFIIAHRLSTIRQADHILVIDDGRIAERGTHAELLAQNGIYGNLYASQFSNDIPETTGVLTGNNECDD
jgi:ATP-binding cassette subfamily B protein